MQRLARSYCNLEADLLRYRAQVVLTCAFLSGICGGFGAITSVDSNLSVSVRVTQFQNGTMFTTNVTIVGFGTVPVFACVVLEK